MSMKRNIRVQSISVKKTPLPKSDSLSLSKLARVITMRESVIKG